MASKGGQTNFLENLESFIFTNVLDDLFILIKSLSDSDKKFFRKYAALQAEDSNYLRLFNFIEALEVYDDELIKDHFKDENFIKQLSVAKNYLNEVILRTFRISAEKESPEIALQLLMMDIRFLLSKKCLVQLKKALKRAKKAAEEQENFLVLMNIYALQRHLLTEFKIEAREEITFDAIATEELTNLKKLENVNLIYDLYCKAKLILSTENEVVASTEINHVLHKIFEHPLMQNESTALSLRAKHWFHSAKHFQHLFFPDIQADLINCKAHLQLFSDNKYFAESRSLSYMTVINNMLEVLRNLNKTSEAEQYLLLLSEINTNNERDDSGKKIYLAHHYMWYYLRTNKMQLAEQIADCEYDRLRQISKLRKDSVIIQHMLIAIVYLMVGNYTKASEVINGLLSISKSGIREDILEHAKLLQLLIQVHYEHLDIAHSLLRSIKRTEHQFPLMVLVAEYYSLYLKNPVEFLKVNKTQLFIDRLLNIETGELREFPEMVHMLHKIWSGQASK